MCLELLKVCQWRYINFFRWWKSDELICNKVCWFQQIMLLIAWIAQFMKGWLIGQNLCNRTSDICIERAGDKQLASAVDRQLKRSRCTRDVTSGKETNKLITEGIVFGASEWRRSNVAHELRQTNDDTRATKIHEKVTWAMKIHE